MENNKLVKSERFMNNVLMNYAAEVGNTEIRDYQKKLIKHLFIKIDFSIKELQKLSSYQDLTWDKINMNKLAIDCVNRVELGLDGLIDGHIFPIAYRNKSGGYDLDLRIGFRGELFYKQNTSRHEIVDIPIRMVYANDTFEPLLKDANNPIENYIHQVKNPFDRGELKGCFGYLDYKEKIRNKIVFVSLKDIEKSKNMAQTKKFWEQHEEAMIYKTIVRKTTKYIEVDPEKINGAYFSAENSEKEHMFEDDEVIDLDENEGVDADDIEEKEKNVKDISEEAGF